MGQSGLIRNLVRTVSLLVIVLAVFAYWQGHRLSFGGKAVLAKTQIRNTESSVVILSSLDKDNRPQYFLALNQPKAEQIALSGFEDNIEFCSSSVDLSGSGKNIVCLWGEVGVHSKNLQTFSYRDGELVAIPFAIDVEEIGNITSDVPDYNLSMNGAGEAVLGVFNRDYDSNPLSDAIVSSYTLTNGRFVFDKETRITYDGSR